MPEVKPTYIDDEGFPTEMDPGADSITLNGLTMGGDIAMDSQQITGLAPGTVGTDAVNLAQLDNVSVPATEIGQLLMSLDGVEFSAIQPVTSASEGWLVSADGDLLIEGAA